MSFNMGRSSSGRPSLAGISGPRHAAITGLTARGAKARRLRRRSSAGLQTLALRDETIGARDEISFRVRELFWNPFVQGVFRVGPAAAAPDCS
jgi:hypothetical protein